MFSFVEYDMDINRSRIVSIYLIISLHSLSEKQNNKRCILRLYMGSIFRTRFNPSVVSSTCRIRRLPSTEFLRTNPFASNLSRIDVILARVTTKRRPKSDCVHFLFLYLSANKTLNCASVKPYLRKNASPFIDKTVTVLTIFNKVSCLKSCIGCSKSNSLFIDMEIVLHKKLGYYLPLIF